MTVHSYLLFVLAALALVLAPGPDMLYMLGRCVAQGRRAGILSALGFGLGVVLARTAHKNHLLAQVPADRVSEVALHGWIAREQNVCKLDEALFHTCQN